MIANLISQCRIPKHRQTTDMPLYIVSWYSIRMITQESKWLHWHIGVATY